MLQKIDTVGFFAQGEFFIEVYIENAMVSRHFRCVRGGTALHVGIPGLGADLPAEYF